MTKCYLIDSNIWHYAYIVPDKEDFLEIHNTASSFIKNVLKDDSIIIATTHYHIAETMDLLRKGNLQKDLREKISHGFKTPKFHQSPDSFSDWETQCIIQLQTFLSLPAGK